MLGICSNTSYRVTAPSSRRWRREGNAFTLIEVMFAIFVLLVMALMFSAVSVSATRASRFGNSYSQAMSLAQHKIDQLQDIGYGSVKDASVQGLLVTAKIIDDPNVNYPTGNSPADTKADLTKSGTMYTGYFTNVDNLPSYFPVSKDGTGKLTSSAAMGKIELTPYPFNKADASNLKIKVTITWQDSGYAQSTYTTEAILTKTPNLL